MSVLNGQLSESQWMRPILDAQNVEWSGREISLLERALAGTSEAYRENVLLSLINCGYRPTEETLLIAALFGRIKEIALEVPDQLAGSRVEFSAFVDRVIESVAEQKEHVDGFALTVQRIMVTVGERLKEQAANLATDYVSATLAAKDAEIRRQISLTIGDVVRSALSQALTDNEGIIAQIRQDALGTVKAESDKVVKVPIPFRFVASGGVGINPKSLVPIALASALFLFGGIEVGHAFPTPEVASAARYGEAVVAHRKVMPAGVRSWLDNLYSHVALDKR